MTADHTTRSPLAGLNGLRALACLAVFGVHFYQKTGVSGNLGAIDIARLLENGNTGVALFFILSGFLLGLPYWSSQQAAGFIDRDLKTYIIKRLARILPAYYLCLSALVLLQGHLSSPKEFIDTALHYLFLHNYTEFSFYSINSPFWTIAVQAQFYVLLPLLLILLSPLRPKKSIAFAATLVLAAGAFAGHYWLMTKTQSVDPWPLSRQIIQRNGAVLSHSVLAHLPHFLLGLAAGYIGILLNTNSGNRAQAKRWMCELIFWLSAVVIIAVLGSALDEMFSISHGRYNLPVVPVLITALIVCAPETVIGRGLLENYPLRQLGVISYGVYVYHLPCMNVVARLMNRWEINSADRWAIFALLSFAVTLVIAMGSYLIVERPILRAVHRTPQSHPQSRRKITSSPGRS